MKRQVSIALGMFIVYFCFVASSYAAAFVDFDSFPITAKNKAPITGGGWNYSLSDSNHSRWVKDTAYQGASSIYDYINLYSANYNTEHMGFENYGFLQITDHKAVSGNSLEYVITGGRNITTCPNPSTDCDDSGLPLYDKQAYLNYISKGQSPVAGDIIIGNPYLYFGNNSSSSNPVHFEASQGANRLSMYLWLPGGLSIGDGGWRVPPKRTLSIGPYSNVPRVTVFPDDISSELISGHWYNDYSINGGGWIHIQIDGHPQHNNGFSNANLYPFPSRSIRNIGKEFFDSMHKFYITTGAYNGFEIPKFSIYIDEIEFLTDLEPQNNETINSVAILYKLATNSFEISFKDKYKNNQFSWSTYELRYSFTPITNSNWAQATPAHILQNPQFSIGESLAGIFDKHTPYYQSMWAPFRLNEIDMLKLSIGKTIYLAIKDISQVGGDGLDPISSSGGRDYRNHGETFDYAGDKDALPLIKRIDYIISESVPLPPVNLKFH